MAIKFIRYTENSANIIIRDRVFRVVQDGLLDDVYMMIGSREEFGGYGSLLRDNEEGVYAIEAGVQPMVTSQYRVYKRHCDDATVGEYLNQGHVGDAERDLTLFLFGPQGLI